MKGFFFVCFYDSKATRSLLPLTGAAGSVRNDCCDRGGRLGEVSRS